MPESDPAPIPESELQVANLLSWARSQPLMKVHPGVVARGEHLAMSMPVSEGTPLIGVMSGMYLEEMLDLPTANEATAAEAECHRLTKAAEEPSKWPLRLAVRLLKEANDPESPWQAYIQSLAPHPRAPLLWSVTQANELQYLPAKRELRRRLLEIRDFHDTNLAGSPLLAQSSDLIGFAALVATAAARGIEVEPGRRALMPLLDLICPPEGPVDVGQAPLPASCSLSVDGNLREGLAMVTAARDLPAGEVLTRDHGLTHDQLFLSHGLASAGGGAMDDVVLWVGVGRDAAKSWQLRELRQALPTEPGPNAGDLIVRSSVKRGRKLSEAIGRGLIHASRVLACKKESELHGVVEWARDESKASKGLVGLGSEQRRAVISNLVHAIERYQEMVFDTTLEQDERLLSTVRGNWRVAVAYRLEKKRVLRDVLALLERAKDREVERRARSLEEAHLPAAVTGRKRTTRERSFGKDDASAGELGSKGKGSASATEGRISKGARVEMLKGIYKGAVGVVATEPNSLGSVTLKLEGGKNLEYVSLQHLRPLEPAPEEAALQREEPNGPEEATAAAEEEAKSEYKPLDFGPPPQQAAPTAEAVSPTDLDAILDMADDVEPPAAQGRARRAPSEVVDVEETAGAEEAVDAVPDGEHQSDGTDGAEVVEVVENEPEGMQDSGMAESGPAAEVEPPIDTASVAEETQTAAPAPEVVEPATTAADAERGDEPGTPVDASGVPGAADLADVDSRLQELRDSVQALERQKVMLAMRSVGIEEEKVQKVMQALGGDGL